MKDPSIRRSLALFRAFRHEQEDPEACYSLLARDAADQVEAYGGPVKARTVVDVGGGGGYFTEEFRRRGAGAYLFEPDVGELGPKPPAGSVVADGYLLPSRTRSPTSASPPTFSNTWPIRRPSSARWCG
ncbi:hypothetical protein SAV14893_053200 [Streptomyces avermitilis]|uniref:Methyltransferase type 11 domain-containing protein n=1 Tax=Streptomyces avermitilis TaxID=33903 RepID=A0A4D4M2G4_STRAX|nr:hypothetical protein SAV14893_053200 [Streptomyces avermitilis]